MNANWKEIDFELERRAKEIKRLTDHVRELEAASANDKAVRLAEAELWYRNLGMYGESEWYEKRLAALLSQSIAAPATSEPVEGVEAIREWQREWFKANRVTVYNNQISIDHIELMLRDFAAAQRGKPKPEANR